MSDLIAQSIAEHRLNRFYYERFQRDNPILAPLVLAYLDGGARPAASIIGQNHYALGLVLAEDARRALAPPPPPSPTIFAPTKESDWTFIQRAAPDRFRYGDFFGRQTVLRAEVRSGDSGYVGGTDTAMAQKDGLANVGLGHEVYLDFDVFVPGSYTPTPNTHSNVAAEWHGTNAQMTQAPFHLGFDGSTGQWYADLHNEVAPPEGWKPAVLRNIGPPVRDAWENFRVGVGWSESSDGWLRVWRDGRLVMEWAGRTWPTGFRQGLKPQLGIYRKAHVSTAVLYLDTFRVEA